MAPVLRELLRYLSSYYVKYIIITCVAIFDLFACSCDEWLAHAWLASGRHGVSAIQFEHGVDRASK